ncbi:hypothetical protein GHK92_19205 [Nocardioides sp. dk4132]|uniref:hypothetical protein n=1 Tax=unclassified Nocardioides TaxID=2615069 RepID=UPI0012977B45|nr:MULTISPECIES: hypothetical protein [unclassified Nocardioides]MQW77999.1 hypothetical protein [Nocardioides sp. dk4132]QGA08107.1 hypothetical protein GFH29_12385 [Nocardioides sp. dk884]
MDDNDQLDASGHAAAARKHVDGFNRTARGQPEQTPAETSSQLAEFAVLTAALPQAVSQLSSTLEQALASQALIMDSMTDESDPAITIGVARLHLEEARGLAVDLHKHLNAAHDATAHVVSPGVDNGHESMPWLHP